MIKASCLHEDTPSVQVASLRLLSKQWRACRLRPASIFFLYISCYGNLSKSHQFWNPEIVRIWTASIRSEIAYSAYREEWWAKNQLVFIQPRFIQLWTPTTNWKKVIEQKVVATLVESCWITATLLVHDLVWWAHVLSIGRWEICKNNSALCCREGAQWLPFETLLEPFNISTRRWRSSS